MQDFFAGRWQVHRSKVGINLFAERKVKVLRWLSNNPDLSPIENLWTEIKYKVTEKKPLTSEEYSKSWIHSMPRRLKKVIKSDRSRAKH